MKRSRFTTCCLATILLGGLASAAAQTPLGTEFTYQGLLKDGGSPAGGDYDFVFRLYDADTDGTQIGSDFPVDDWPVVDGLFTLQLDFGAGAFDSDARWIEIDVRAGARGGDYTTLSPRQPVTAAPVALYALDGPGSAGYWAASGSDIHNTNSGNVGIGTSSPAWQLEVANPAAGGSVEIGVTADDAGGALAVYSSTYPFPHFADRVSLFTHAVTATGLDLRADGATSDIRFYTGGFGPSNERMRITDAGHVGIGTDSPDNAILHVVRPAESSADFAIRGDHPDGIGIQGTSEDGYGVLGLGGGIGGIGVFGWGAGESTTGVFGVAFGEGSYAGYFNGRGYFGAEVGIQVPDPQATLDVLSYSSQTAIRGVTSAGGYGVYGFSPSGVGVYGASSTGYAGFFNGTVSVNVLEIVGADVAEKFPVSEAAGVIEPGMVMEIDPENAGKLRVARGAYNRRVAGVVSGAGDIPVGAVLGNLPGCEDAPAIALSGRVWVQCDAGEHAISPGDLLTTSDTPGYAMKVTEQARAQGAILGKAMTSLSSGEGLVLVLVTLQ